MKARVVGLLGLAAVSLLAVPAAAVAQSGFHPRWEIPGFDIRRDGAWRVKARQVSALRRQLLGRGDMKSLNAGVSRAPAGPTATAVTGTIQVPIVMMSYPETNLSQKRDSAQYNALLFGTTPPLGNPYTLRTYYEQMSTQGVNPPLFSMQGRSLGWVTLSSSEATYTGSPGSCTGNQFGTTNCNGIFSNSAILGMQGGMREALTQLDASVNFGLFDNDGPDGVPNSGDDDGFVDMMGFIHPTKDGACGGFPANPPNHSSNNHIWSHRFVLVNSQFNQSPFVTTDARPGGGTIRVLDYFMSSGLGGASGCDTTQIMPIGTAAHEFGHALGLPDLYDTGGGTEGIGRWGLMGAGNGSSAVSPARMEAWSLSELGWVTVQQVTTTGTRSFSAAPVSDTAFYINVQGANPRGEYFLLENRQPVQADTALISNTCRVWFQSSSPPSCAGGLLIWHVDGTIMGGSGNSRNAGAIHGLKLEEADGARDLWCPGATPLQCNRGDAGDPFAGIFGNTAFVVRTTPAATKNSDGSFAGFGVDQITQVVPGGEMSFRVRFGALTVVRASDTAAVVSVDGSPFNVFRDLLVDGSAHSVSVADTQLSTNGRTRWRFVSWSDAGARSHGITGSPLGGETYTANLARDFKLIATTVGDGTISPIPAVNLAGEFIADGNGVELTATPNGGAGFCSWTGDTTSSSSPLTLPMTRPYTVTATFGTAVVLTTAPTARPNGVMGVAYSDALQATGGTGTYSWSVTGGALPQGVTLNSSTGTLSGFPREAGSFSYQATVTSCTSQSQPFTFSVTAPALATADVVTHLLGPAAPLNADQVRYLDFLGNNNSTFDIGDFLAWVKATGAPLSAAMMDIVGREKGGRP